MARSLDDKALRACWFYQSGDKTKGHKTLGLKKLALSDSKRLQNLG
jgi:hypothetical protein